MRQIDMTTQTDRQVDRQSKSRSVSQPVSQLASQSIKERQLIQEVEIMIKYRHNIDRDHRGNIIIRALLCMKEVVLEIWR